MIQIEIKNKQLNLNNRQELIIEIEDLDGDSFHIHTNSGVYCFLLSETKINDVIYNNINQLINL